MALVKEFNPYIIFPLMELSVEANAIGRYTVFPKQDSAVVIKPDGLDEAWGSIIISRLRKRFIPGTMGVRIVYNDQYSSEKTFITRKTIP